jgi:hypothetical protein
MKYLKTWGILTAIMFYFLGQAIFISFTMKSYLGYVPWLFVLGFYWGFIIFHVKEG